MTGLATRFHARFGTVPRLFRAPGRINIIGEHTDYTGGLVMPSAIDRWCTVAATTNGTRALNVIAASFGKEAQADLDALKPDGSWIDYVAGVAAVLMQNGIAVPGADLMIESDVPVGAGVSSSAALEISVAHGLLALAGVDADGVQIARWAQAAENSFVGMPCGIMDQFASANGRADAALLLDCRSLAVRMVPLPREAAFLIVNSMVRHAHTEGAYRSRRADCETAAQTLGVPSLRDVDKSALPAALAKLSDGPAKRCRHVVTENARVEAAAAAMIAGDLPALGALLNASHASLRDDMEVSVPQVDELAAIAQKTPGVFGARMMGGGFGGCVIALVAADKGEAARTTIVERYARVIGTMPDAFICRAVDGAGEIAA
ncbi:MAG TPA: galactokinase [Rhizomicrobium sp.]